MDKNKKISLIIIFVFIPIVAGCVGPTTKAIKPDDAAVALEAERQREFALKEAIRNQKRLHNVAWPILKAGFPLCIDRNRRGVGIKAINKYDIAPELHDAAVSLYGLGENMQIVSVAEDSPAALAGMQEGDVIVSVNAKSTPVGKKASAKYLELLREVSEDEGALSFIVNRANLNMTINISPDEICDYPTIIISDNAVNAYADGNNIVVNQGMMDFAKTDQELSIVVAHELAHNNMRHIDAKKFNYALGFMLDILFAGLTGVDAGIRNATAMAYSKDFETEADYVGMYILARADIDITNAPDFWRRMGVKHPGSIEKKGYLASHPSTPERFVSIEETLKEIQFKQDNGQELMPNIDEEKRQKRDPPPSQAEKINLGT